MHYSKLKYLFGYLFALIYGFPYRKLVIIGITGTDGKTTTASVLYALLKSQGKRVALFSTIECKYFDGANEREILSFWNKLDMPLREIIKLPLTKKFNEGQHVTTAWAPTIQHILHKLVALKCEYVVLESTSHALHQHRLAGLQYDLVGVTNISHEHLDYHKTMDNYLNAKSLIFKTEQFLPQKKYRARIGFVNADDEASAGFIGKEGLFKIKRFSLMGNGDCNAEVNNVSLQGSEFTYGGCKMQSSLIGKYNIYNCFLALVLFESLGFEVRSATDAMKSISSPKGRFELFTTRSHGSVVVDFAHTPQSYEKLFSFVRPLIKGRIIAVFGSAGLRDQKKRPLMGKIAANYSDIVVITSEDPRTEKVEDIGAQILSGVLLNNFLRAGSETQQKKVYYEEYDRAAAIRLAIRLSKPGDYVFVLGKGHEESMCFGENERPWSDQIAVREVIASLESVV